MMSRPSGVRDENTASLSTLSTAAQRTSTAALVMLEGGVAEDSFRSGLRVVGRAVCWSAALGGKRGS